MTLHGFFLLFERQTGFEPAFLSLPLIVPPPLYHVLFLSYHPSRQKLNFQLFFQYYIHF